MSKFGAWLNEVVTRSPKGALVVAFGGLLLILLIIVNGMNSGEDQVNSRMNSGEDQLNSEVEGQSDPHMSWISPPVEVVYFITKEGLECATANRSMMSCNWEYFNQLREQKLMNDQFRKAFEAAEPVLDESMDIAK